MADKSQLDKFREIAREIGADMSGDALDKVMGRLDLKKKPDEKDGKPSK